MDKWVAFSAARIDEDEHFAKTAHRLARKHREQMLREVAFKRAVLAMHMPEPFWGNNPPRLRDRTPENAVAWHCQCQCPDGMIEGTYPCETARLLAAIWDGHPDYPGDR